MYCPGDGLPPVQATDEEAVVMVAGCLLLDWFNADLFPEKYQQGPRSQKVVGRRRGKRRRRNYT